MASDHDVPSTSRTAAERYEELIFKMRTQPVLQKAGESFPYTPQQKKKKNPDMVSLSDLQSADNRLGNTNWCFCGNCVPMPTTTESICCLEEPAIEIKIPEGGHCVTECQHFDTHFTNKEQADLNLKMQCWNMKKKPKESEYLRGLRKASYRCFTAWVYGYLGSGIRKPIPACAVKAIRSFKCSHPLNCAGTGHRSKVLYF
uniref:P2X purinoreceptor 7 intracellular domain-containing protein n=1 Tax=Xenopus tropicalis TaxID=8364 RepID=A0A803KBP4_XENTR